MDRDSLRNRYKRRDFTRTTGKRQVSALPPRPEAGKKPPKASADEEFWAVLPPEQLPLPGPKRILAIIIELFKLFNERVVRRIPKKYLFIGAAVVLIAALSAALMSSNPSKQNTAKNKPGPANPAVPAAQSNANLKPSTGVPKFTTYYPSVLPKPMAVNRSSVRYASDSFNFTVSYSDNPLFFISEKSVPEDFNLNYFNNRLQDIKSTAYFIGNAITGKDGIDQKTAILTKDRTLIVISCDGSYYCNSQSDTLARSLQINTDDSMFDKGP